MESIETDAGTATTDSFSTADTAAAPTDWQSEARAHLSEPGDYLAWEEDGHLLMFHLARDWTRVGRSVAADIRFDDGTVSRRHALLMRRANGVRILDDGSLNGVYVNGERVSWQPLRDGDEIQVGRHQLRFVQVPDRSAV
jgi:hypothetical protein